ncbi:MAG: SRPBCC domain-containing protein [Ferruginibacter sp.]
MNTYNWTSFIKRININAPVSAIYEMWATPIGLEKWFLRQCMVTDKSNGAKDSRELLSNVDKFVWRWFGYADDVVEKGSILLATGKDELQFTFGQEGAEDMICTVKIYAEDGETICEIKQENIPEDEKGKAYYHVGCSIGWTFYLANLKSILEGGIDLRNKNEHLRNMINS